MNRNTVWEKAREAQAEIKLNAVLAEAAALFNAKGYHATSLADVAGQLEITKTALYYYVKNKNDLLYQTYVRSLQEIERATADAETKGGNGLEKLCQYVLSQAFVHQEASALINEIDAISDPNRRENIRKQLEEANKTISCWIEEGIRDGSVAECNVDLAGRFVMGAFNWVPRWLPQSDKTMQEVARYFVDLTCKTLEPDR